MQYLNLELLGIPMFKLDPLLTLLLKHDGAEPLTHVNAIIAFKSGSIKSV